MKLWNYMVMLVAMMIFMEFVGIPTGLSLVLNTVGININPVTHELINADIESSSLFNWIFAATGVLVVLAGGAAVIVGLFAKSYDTSLVILPAIISVGGLFAGTFGFVIQHISSYGDSWATKIVVIIFGTLGVGFLWSCVEFFRGSD